MFINDLFLISFWLILLLTLAFSAFPLVWHLLHNLPDGGFAISPVIGIIFPGWLAWILSSLHILPFNISAPVAFSILLISGILTLARYRLEIKQFVREKRLILFIELTLFTISLFAWSIVRGFQPNIQGLEKFMDMGFVNSILKSRFMPPNDIWLSGETINYYYFGHYLTAFVTLLSGIDSAYTYNLMLATIFALSMLGSFGFTYNTIRLIAIARVTHVGGPHPLRRIEASRPPAVCAIGAAETRTSDGGNKRQNPKMAIVVGILTAILLNFGGNLHTAWHFATQQSKPYWYPDATRFIPYTIHEFPAYSHVVADLHGHLLDLPIVLMFLTILIVYMKLKTRNSKLETIKPNFKIQNNKKSCLENSDLEFVSDFGFRISDFKIPILLGFLIGVMTMTNFWDLPIYGLVFGLAAVAKGLTLPGKVRPYQVFGSILVSCFLSLITALLVSLPFHLHFKNFSQGIALVQARSALWQLAVLWGGFALIGLIAIWLFIRFTRLSFASQKFGGPIHIFPLVLVFVSFLLILIPEIIYVKDIYIREYHRANTMFKLTYQSFVMMCLVWGLTLGSLLSSLRGQRPWQSISAFLLILIFAAHMLYPFYSIKSYYGLKTYRGLYGLQFLQTSYPDDYAAILWLKKNIRGNPVILEAVGESYTDHARVSSFTGLPTILGWRVHEWLWRGSFDEAGKRTEIVRKMYENPTSTEAKTLFNQYQVKYIFVGDLERKDYKLDEKGIQSISIPIFRSGATMIYRIN